MKDGKYTQNLLDKSKNDDRLTWHELLWMRIVWRKWRLWGWAHAKAWKDKDGAWHSYPDTNWRRVFWS